MKKYHMLAAALCFAVLLCGFAAPAYAYAGGGDEATGGYDPEPPAVETPAPEPKPFTPPGAGTVVDNATGEDGKEFFTIQTPDEHVFYLVIDRQRGTVNRKAAMGSRRNEPGIDPRGKGGDPQAGHFPVCQL